MTDFTTYQSPFTWRYASPEMRRIWSEAHKRRLWRQIWVALAEVQSGYGLVRPEQAADLRAHVDEINLPRALEIEAEIHHDLMAEVRTYAEQALLGGGIIHLGATSCFVTDNGDLLIAQEALALLRRRVQDVVAALADEVALVGDPSALLLKDLLFDAEVQE